MESNLKLSDLKPIKSEGINLNKFHNQKVTIENAELMQVKSKFTPKKDNEHIPQWVLKVSSPVLITVGEGEDLLEFRASELFNLIQDKEGKLIGYPESLDSNLQKFMKDIGATKPQDIVGKTAMIKAYEKETEEGSRTYLKFKY